MDNREFKERIFRPIPDHELARRHAAARAAMDAQGIDCLLMQNDNQYLGGYVRYFTDIPAMQAYPMTVLFFSDGEIVTITNGKPANPLPPPWAARVITKRLSSAYFRSIGATDTYDAELIVQEMKAKNVKRIGTVGRGLLNFVLIDYLRANGGADIVDATPYIEAIKVIKSPDELEAIQASLNMHDKVADFLSGIIRPGIYEFDIRAELVRMLIKEGSEEQMIMIGSCPGGTFMPQYHTFYQNRRIEEGDDIVVLAECSGPGGYYCELGRIFCLGEPSPRLLEACNQSQNIQAKLAGAIAPGVKGWEIAQVMKDALAELGLPPEDRAYGHGQGYDLVEAPALSSSDEMVLKENMYLALHPRVTYPDVVGWCCDNFLITAEGCKRMTKTPSRIFLCR